MPESYKEDERPAQQWYWNDWFSAFDVRNCCLAARGLWIDMLGIMWKAEIRGTLTVNGKQPDNKTLANIVGSSVSEIKPLLKELETNNVFSRLDDGTIICRRMFRESAKKDDISKIRSKAGKEGAKKRWRNHGKPMAKHGKKNLPLANENGKPMAKTTEVKDSKPSEEKMAKMAASSSTSSSTSSSNLYTPQFKKFWAEYPNKKEKDVAFGVFKNLKKKEQEQVVTAARNYRIQTEREKQERKFIKHPATFLRKNRWKDHLGAPEKEEMDKFDDLQERAMKEKK